MATSTEKTSTDGSVDDNTRESRQLLYPEKYGESYKEDKLQIVGNKKCMSTQLRTQKIPQSSVLSQIKAFLPQLSKANETLTNDLKNRPELADSINIECLDDGDDTESQHIEMNLSLLPPEVLAVSSDDSSSDSESEDNEVVADWEHSPEGEGSTTKSPTANGSEEAWLKFPDSSKKKMKDGQALIEEIVIEDSPDEDFTNR